MVLHVPFINKFKCNYCSSFHNVGAEVTQLKLQ